MRTASGNVIQSAAAALPLAEIPGAARPLASRAAIGIGMYSYGEAWRAGQAGDPDVPFKGALGFLEYAHTLGAAGVQVALRTAEFGDAPQIRNRSAELGLYFEGQASLPRSEAELQAFEATVKAVRAAGAAIGRTAVLSGRRYETFKSAAEWREFKEGGWKSLVLAEPVVRRHGLKLAVENHKDWLVPELTELLRRLGSEWVGACVDTGNSIALTEDPYAVVEVLAPFAFSTHLKDMAVREYADGFLLSEVPLGTGFLDLRRIVEALRRANPRVALNLEMITRDPLRVPCLTPGYWVTLGEMKGAQLAGALALVKRCAAAGPLPESSSLPPARRQAMEDENVRRSLAWATEVWG